MTITGLIWSLLQPSSWIVWLGVAAIILHWREKAIWRNRAVGSLLALLLIIGILPTGRWLLWTLERPYHHVGVETPVKGIIVLGGAELVGLSEDFGQAMPNRYAHRWTHALALANQYPAAKVIFTGGMVKDASKLTEAGVFKQFWQASGMPLARLTLETQAFNSASNATGVAGLAGVENGEGWLLVTSAFHMPRSLASFQAVGLTAVKPSPAGFIAREELLANWPTLTIGSNLSATDLAFHEYVGLIYYRVTGKTDSLWPAEPTKLEQE